MFNKLLDRGFGRAQPATTEMVAQEVESPFDPSEKRLVGMLL
jgi:hypothetical protein